MEEYEGGSQPVTTKRASKTDRVVLAIGKIALVGALMFGSVLFGIGWNKYENNVNDSFDESYTEAELQYEQDQLQMSEEKAFEIFDDETDNLVYFKDQNLKFWNHVKGAWEYM